MSPERLQEIPNWPARMDARMAANYLSISVTTLSEGSDKGRYPRPVRDGKRVLWSKRQLDQFVDEQFGLGAAPNGSWDDLT